MPEENTEAENIFCLLQKHKHLPLGYQIIWRRSYEAKMYIINVKHQSRRRYNLVQKLAAPVRRRNGSKKKRREITKRYIYERRHYMT
jgi:hypothetical protein